MLLVDDHPFVREGIRSYLSDFADIEIVGEASSGQEALHLTKEHRPDLILLDINMPGMNGLEVVGQLRKNLPQIKILVLTVHNSREYVMHVAKSGAQGYLLKESPPEELLQAIRAIQGGGTYYSPRVAIHLVEEFQHKSNPRSEPSLAPRELEVLIHTAKGKSIKEMAEIMDVTAATVQTYRVRLMEKLNLHHVAGLTKYAVQRGLVQ
jgi:two-component system nitrate/nitrite response regulator NarL